MTNPVDSAGHPQIDFVWGNAPMQPNDERGLNLLDPVLDSHEIAYLGWNGFPAYVPNTINGGGSGSGSVAGSGSGSGSGNTVIMPYLIGLGLSQAQSTLMNLGLNLGIVPRNNSQGSNAQNNQTIADQGYPAGQPIAIGQTVTVQVYSYAPPVAVFPPTNVWNWDAAFNRIVFTPGYPDTGINDAINNDHYSYNLVIVGGPAEGTYPVQLAEVLNGQEAFAINGWTFGSTADSSGTANIMHDQP